MIFGELLTGSNFDDSERKITGGRNGYGAKLANILSRRFTVRTGDRKRRKLLSITWKNNMSKKMRPELEKYKGKDFTEVIFEPDLKLFGFETLSADMVSLFEKRVIDLAGVLPKSVKVNLNGVRVECQDFRSYCRFYFRTQIEKEEKMRAEGREDFEPFNLIYMKKDRWEVGVVLSESKFSQVSFVNSICTSRGGSHVNYIVDQIIAQIRKKIIKKHKKANIKPYIIKNNLFLFVNCLIENPAFDSQTKETLKKAPSKFGSKCELTSEFMSKVMSTGLLESILFMLQAKEKLAMNKLLNAKKKKRLIDVDKLEDANKAGGRESEECVLILTEGDSAKTLAISGLEIVGREYYGVYPIRGKFLNVRQAENKTIMKNKEIQNLMKIVGLQMNKDYRDLRSLRYGGIMIMTDQDVDGSHIKGLLMNFISFFWPSLIKRHGFLIQFVTPILKAFGPRKTVFSFFTAQDFKKWASRRSDIEKFDIKYYKGLGTSTDDEARDYFREFEKHTIKFRYEDNEDLKSLEMVFGKDAEQRKKWLDTYDENLAVDHNRSEISYKEWVDQEMIHFSVYSNLRTICHIIDGLKPSKRKIIYGFFKRNLKKEVKVAQISGYIAEHSAYHHGEVSLQNTIVKLAQNYVGSNNLNLLEPIGQFGTRLMGGKDHASPRYINTKLSSIARKLFPEHDDHLLDYLVDDGKIVEPKFYVPILPYILINGSIGIGTGYSSTIPCYEINQIAQQFLKKLETGEDFSNLVPWFKGFKGEIVVNQGKGFITKGTFELDQENCTLSITELPIGSWTKNYKEQLNKMIKDDYLIEDFTEHHTVTSVDFRIVLKEESMRKLQSAADVEKIFKLNSRISTNNMVMFNCEGKIRKFQEMRHIMEHFYHVRLEFYKKRKQYLVSLINRDLKILENKIKFIRSVMERKLKIQNRGAKAILTDLVEMGFLSMDQIPRIESTKAKLNDKRKGIIEESENQENSDEEEAAYGSGGRREGLTGRQRQGQAGARDGQAIQLPTVDSDIFDEQREAGENGKAGREKAGRVRQAAREKGKGNVEGRHSGFSGGARKNK